MPSVLQAYQPGDLQKYPYFPKLPALVQYFKVELLASCKKLIQLSLVAVHVMSKYRAAAKTASTVSLLGGNIMPSIALQHLDYGEKHGRFPEVGYVLSQNSTQQYLVRSVLSFRSVLTFPLFMLRSNSEKLQDGIEMAKKQASLNFSAVFPKFSLLNA